MKKETNIYKLNYKPSIKDDIEDIHFCFHIALGLFMLNIELNIEAKLNNKKSINYNNSKAKNIIQFEDILKAQKEK